MGYLVSRPDLLEDNVRPCFKKKKPNLKINKLNQTNQLTNRNEENDDSRKKQLKNG